MPGHDRWSGGLVLALGGLLLAYAAVRVAAPFVSVLAAAAIVAVLVHPLYLRLSRKLSSSAAAAAIAGSVCVAFAVPLCLGVWYAARESIHAYPVVRRAIEEVTAPGARPPPWLPDATAGYLRDVNVRDLLLENVHEIGSWAGRVAGSATASAALLAMDVLVFVLCLFLFLRDGREALARVSAAVPMAARSKERILGRAHEMIIATVEGVFVVALLQGVLSMIGFLFLRVPFPVLLGALCMSLSPIPFFGPTLVWIPVAAAVALGGEPGRAALLAGWFALVVGTSDNFVRPILIGARARLPVGLVVIGVLGGLKAFGLIGTFLGPVIAALAVAVLDTLLREAADERA